MSTAGLSMSIEVRSMPSRSRNRSRGRSGETWSRSQRWREQLRPLLEEQSEQTMTLVRAAARAVEARIDDEAPQPHAAARAGDGIACERPARRRVPLHGLRASAGGGARRAERVSAAGAERARPSRASVPDGLSILSGSVSASRRPRLLVFNQYYWPGRRSDGSPADGAVRGARVGVRRHRDHRPAARLRDMSRTTTSGTASRSFECTRRPSIVLRSTAALRTTSRIWRARCDAASPALRPDLVLCMTDPADGGGRRSCRREAVPGTACRRQPGRLSGDRCRARASSEPIPRRRCSAS